MIIEKIKNIRNNMTEEQMKKSIKKFVFLNLGLFVASISAALYLTPGRVPAGGVYSLALVINVLFNLGSGSVGAISLALNIPILLWSWFTLGREATLKIVYSSLAFSGFLIVSDALLYFIQYDPSNPNPIVASLLGGLLLSFGMAIAIASGGNTGGSDTIGQILHKYFPGISIGLSIGFVNALILFTSALVLGAGNALLGIFAILIVTFTLDRFLQLLSKTLYRENIE